jgi:H2-forming N5,N10-methylenetetrahydromethanopterin dehydrogenase-like enzyme
MSIGVTRVHGTAVPGTMHGGYQLAWWKVTSTVTNFLTGSGAVAPYNVASTVTNSAFEIAVRAIEGVATVVVLGTPTSAGFVVGIDGGDYYGRGDNTGYAASTSVAVLQNAINSFLTTTNAVVTATSIAGLTFA